MKGCLVALVILLSGALAWSLLRPGDVRSFANLANGDVEEQVSESKAEIQRLRTELLQYKTRLQRYETVEVATAVPAAPVTDASSPATAPAGTLSERLNQLEVIYRRNQQALRDESTAAKVALADAETAYKTLERSPPQFQEHSVVTTVSGDGSTSSANRGTRTSQADRDRAMKKYNEELEGLRGGIADSRKRIVDVEDRLNILERQYRDAIEKVRAEFPK